MRGLDLPYHPIRTELYTPEELFGGYEPDQPGSWVKTPDFIIYRHFISQGGTPPENPYLGMMQALHDQTITQGCTAVLAGRKVAAVMGGHRLRRDDPAYRETAELARRLTRNGILVTSGGGPGAMEATHLGAALSRESDDRLNWALELLQTEPAVPAVGKVVDGQGEVDRTLAAQAHAWFRPADQVAQAIENPGESLAVPTWHYGHEPSTPFATWIAKYFQNSIREAGLTSLARQGIIFTKGKAGTLQEIFQDSNQNYYRTHDHFSPMVFLGEEYWTEKIPAVAVLKNLFSPGDFEDYVLVTDDVPAAAEFIESFQP
jgi:predicted Rossmann-fold nucleotide-binding protein